MSTVRTCHGTTAGSSSGAAMTSGTWRTSSHRPAPCMWYTPRTSDLSSNRSPHDSPWSAVTTMAVESRTPSSSSVSRTAAMLRSD